MRPVLHPGPRAALAASYEAQHGPLPDVVETCGQSLVGGFSNPASRIRRHPSARSSSPTSIATRATSSGV